MKIPRIETTRLVLRAFTQDDLEPLHAIVSDPDVVRYFPRSDPWPIEIAQKCLDLHWEHWREHGFGWWAVECKACGELLGWCGLNVLDETGETEVKYLFKKSHWGRGLGTEAARRCVAFAFTDLNLEMLIGLVLPGNIASQRVLEKSGMTFRDLAEYFGCECLRYTVDKAQFEEDGAGDAPCQSSTSER